MRPACPHACPSAYLLTRLPTCSPTCPLAHPSTCLLARLLACLLACSPTCLPARSLVQPPACSATCLLACPLACSSACPTTCPPACLPAHLLTHLPTHPPTCTVSRSEVPLCLSVHRLGMCTENQSRELVVIWVHAHEGPSCTMSAHELVVGAAPSFRATYCTHYVCQSVLTHALHSPATREHHSNGSGTDTDGGSVPAKRNRGRLCSATPNRLVQGSHSAAFVYAHLLPQPHS